MNFLPTLGLCGLSALALVSTPTDDQGCCSSTPKVALASSAVAQDKDIVEVSQGAGSFGTLLKAASAAGLVDALKGDGPLTVFAPTDEAFAKLDQALLGDLLKPENKTALQTVLKHHIVPGRVDSATVVGMVEARALGGQRLAIRVDDSGVNVGGANVTTVDIPASNGIIHVIDQVIVPNTDDVIDTALADGSFTTLAKALQAGGLVEALKGEGPFTVFAPTDEAFAKLDPKVLGDLLKPENKDQLVAILKYHVVPGRLSARTAVAAGVAETLQGQNVRVRIDGGRLMANGAHVVASDLDATNGVIHVIDTVLLPR
jgi:uncharacterized surface protein with fasciclin (FAS1) repeats